MAAGVATSVAAGVVVRMAAGMAAVVASMRRVIIMVIARTSTAMTATRKEHGKASTFRSNKTSD